MDQVITIISKQMTCKSSNKGIKFSSIFEKHKGGKNVSIKTAVQTNLAPLAIGPYSQAIKIDSFYFCSGQIPIDPKTSKLIGENIIEQSRQVLENIKALLESSGLTLNDVIKTTVFLKDLKTFSTVNEIYNQYFEKPYPARSTIGVSELPLGSLIEIEAIAHRK